MKLRRALLLSLATLTFTALGSVRPCAAETLKFPTDKPIFIIEIPEGWTKKANTEGTFRWEAPGDSNYSVQVIAMPDATTKAEVHKKLPQAAKVIAKAMGVEDPVLGDVEDERTTDGIQFTGLRADCKLANGDSIVLILQGFEPRKGKWYALVTLGTEAADKAHDKDYDAIVGSITLLK